MIGKKNAEKYKLNYVAVSFQELKKMVSTHLVLFESIVDQNGHKSN